MFRLEKACYGIILLIMLTQVVIASVYYVDNFDDNKLDGWTVYDGEWNAVNGKCASLAGLGSGARFNCILLYNYSGSDNYMIEAKLRFLDKDQQFGFRAGIVFRFNGNEKFYSFILSNNYDCYGLIRYTGEDYGEYGVDISNGNTSCTVQNNVDYKLTVIALNDSFSCFINENLVMYVTDGNYTTGKVGLMVRVAEVMFDDFYIEDISTSEEYLEAARLFELAKKRAEEARNPPTPTPYITPMPTVTPMPTPIPTIEPTPEPTITPSPIHSPIDTPIPTQPAQSTQPTPTDIPIIVNESNNNTIVLVVFLLLASVVIMIVVSYKW